MKNHRLHPSSGPAFAREDSDMCCVDVDSHLRSNDYGDLHKMPLDLCSFGFLESCLSLNPLNALLSPGLSTSAIQAEVTGPGSPVGLLSLNKCRGESHQVSSFFPVVSDMFLIPVSEHSGPHMPHQHCPTTNSMRAAGDGRGRHSSYTNVCPSHSNVESRCPGHTPLFPAQPLAMDEDVTRMDCPLLHNPTPKVSSKGPIKNPLTQLQNQFCGLQRRLHALLGKQTTHHCRPQLDGPNKPCQLEEASLNSFVHSAMAPPRECLGSHYPWQELSMAPPSPAEVSEFLHSSQAVLGGLQETLDSEATDSSSTDEDPDEEQGALVCELRWLEERAELSGRWSWLQLRLAELEGKIQQLDELQNHLRSNKDKVVLADSQPQTFRQMQHTLMRDRSELSHTASDSDAEPCSPTRLLYSIERQSAQLSQIVRSLMPPLSCSPLSKQLQTSGHREDEAFLCGSSKRRRPAPRKPIKAAASCVCARTRPLSSFQKRKLFTFDSEPSASLQNSVDSASALSSSLLSFCSHGSSCEHAASCSDVGCSSSSVLSSSTSSSKAHSSSSGSSTCHRLQRLALREEWSQRPLVVNAETLSPPNYRRRSSTPMTRHKHKIHSRNHNSRTLDLSPIRSLCSAVGHPSKSNKRRRRRGRVHRPVDDMDVLYRHCYQGDDSSDMHEENYAHVSLNKTAQVFLRRDHGMVVYDINDIVIPMSSPKLEKLQYKDIPTPSWRIVSVEALTETEMQQDDSKQQSEDLTDEVFALRHLDLEQKEKSRWCCRRPARSASRLSGSGSGMCTSGEESCGQLETDELLRSEEWVVPWKPRVFPLDQGEYLDLLEVEMPPGWEGSSSPCLSSRSPAAVSDHLKSCGQLVPHCPLMDDDNSTCLFT